MKKRYKFLSVFLIFMSFSLFNIIGVKSYAAANKVKVNIGENFGALGDNVIIPVNLSNLPSSGLSAFNFVLEYGEALSINSISPGNIVANSSDFTYSIKNNKIYILFSDSTGGNKPIKNEGILCYINLKVNDSKSSLYINRATDKSECFVDNVLNSIDAEFANGKITLKDNLYKVEKDKSWKITFNQEIDPSSLNSSSVEIKDIKGNSINSKLNIINNGKTLEVLPPEGGYNPYGSYVININTNLLSKKGKKLVKGYTINFYIQK